MVKLIILLIPLVTLGVKLASQAKFEKPKFLDREKTMPETQTTQTTPDNAPPADDGSDDIDYGDDFNMQDIIGG